MPEAGLVQYAEAAVQQPALLAAGSMCDKKTEARQAGGVNRDAALLQKVSGKLREPGPWKSDVRTEQKLAWFASFVMSKVTKAASQNKVEWKVLVDELFGDLTSVVGPRAC